jgi:hypothetical protein
MSDHASIRRFRQTIDKLGQSQALSEANRPSACTASSSGQALWSTPP